MFRFGFLPSLRASDPPRPQTYQTLGIACRGGVRRSSDGSEPAVEHKGPSGSAHEGRSEARSECVVPTRARAQDPEFDDAW